MNHLVHLDGGMLTSILYILLLALAPAHYLYNMADTERRLIIDLFPNCNNVRPVVFEYSNK